MPRPERPLDPAAGPIQAFAQQLRDLRRSAGTPKYLQMSRATGRSRTSLAEAAGGDHLPTWETVEAFVSACGGDPAQWRVAWERVREQVRPGEPRPDPAPPAETETLVDTRPEAAPSARRPVVARLVAGVAVGGLVLAGAYWAGARDSGRAGESRRASVPIRVYNKVAVGPSTVAEDTTPSYLSTLPAPRCAARGCKIAGSEVWSGAELVARCWTRGETLTNSDLTSEGIDRNPAAVSSDLWYGIVLHDGRTGYLSEVYVAPEHRGGMGLPRCAQR